MTDAELQAAMAGVNVGQSNDFWKTRQIEVIDRLQRESPADFLKWPEIVFTMFVGDAPYIRTEFNALQASDDWPLWAGVIQESGIGNPARLPYADYTSGNLVHQAYHLMRWQRATGRNVSDLKTIVEIGAGYGAMALLVNRLGFIGRYIVIDLPVFGLLQDYYLSQFGISVEHRTGNEALNTDLLIGLWSLSEMTVKDREQALSGITTDGYLVAGCGELPIEDMERRAARQPISHLQPNSYWML